ncbi:hypothetical protein PoB_001551200 [Plakobranchus ocellatus]|uniref:Uncharacterized protein n=1 Tax=Plakobranchus ocellatus TaxID=259542 RepID=A0AAV3Z380_9GAST|nr:hypothetical protein PoB_001551200 [Plakobranchus ocellatus]
MSASSSQRMEQYLDWLHDKFSESLKTYVSAVKTAIRSQDNESAVDTFRKAIDILSREFPDPTSVRSFKGKFRSHSGSQEATNFVAAAKPVLGLNRLQQFYIQEFSLHFHQFHPLSTKVLLYNCGTWALTKTDEDRLDSFHRKQLRNTLGIGYPTIISNASLYKKCREAPLSMQVLEARWRLFGHVLRRDRNIPANKAMLFYFSDNKRARGRPLTTLPITLNNGLKKLVTTKLELSSISSPKHQR